MSKWISIEINTPLDGHLYFVTDGKNYAACAFYREDNNSWFLYDDYDRRVAFEEFPIKYWMELDLPEDE